MNIGGPCWSPSVCVCAVVVVKRENVEPVTLTCNAKTDGPVTKWTLNGVEVDFDDVQMDGQNLSVPNVDTPMLGEYSCFRGEQKLSSTYLLMETEEQVDLGEVCFFLLLFILLMTVICQISFKS